MKPKTLKEAHRTILILSILIIVNFVITVGKLVIDYLFK